METLKENLFARLRQEGAALMGVADLTGLVTGPWTTGVSVAVPVPPDIVKDLETSPTAAYHRAYHTLNEKLNHIVEAGAAFLVSRGYRARANTTHTVQQDKHWNTPLPHKTVATRAGLGWIGKNCLLVTPEYGGAIRLSSLVTDAPLPPDPAVTESKCGACQRCVEACPAQALTGALWQAGMPREALFQPDVCEKTQRARMKAATGIDADLCGLCFAVCPYTKRYRNRTERGDEA